MNYAYIGAKGFLSVKFTGKMSELLPFLDDYAEIKYDMVDGEIMGDIETYERD